MSGGSDVFQVDAGGFTAGTVLGGAASKPGRVILLPRARSAARRGIDWDRLADVELAVDLGQRIGSRDWWLGLGLLTTLCLSAIGAGVHVGRLPVPVHPALTPAQADDARPTRSGRSLAVP